MSPITTSGFQVSARPGIDYVDPRLMAPAYDRIIPSVSQGLGAVGQLAQIIDDAQSRPIRRRLAQIQLQEAQNRLDLAPLEEQMAVARLQEAQQNAAVPHILTDTVDLSGGEKQLAPRNLDAGFGNIQFDESYAPRIRTTTGREIGAGGVVTPFTRTETLATAAQVEADAIKQAAAIKAQEALATQRGREKEFESQALIRGYQEAIDSGDEEQAAIYKKLIDRKAMAPGILPAGTISGRKLEEIAVRIGIPFDVIQNIADTPAGASAISKLNKQAILASQGKFPDVPWIRLTPDELAAVNAAKLGGADTPAINASVPSFSTVAEAEAAAKAGKLKDGTKIIVGGKPATWKD